MEATIAQAAWGRLFRAAMDTITDCFARRETRLTATEMVTGLLTEVDTRNCWTLAEALGHPGPHRLQHLLSRKKLVRLRRRASTSHTWGHPLTGTWTRMLFARAQLKVESLHYRQRQQLMEYEDWLNKVYYQMGA